ncbi:MAG: NADP-specific glutamate dehydrogenase [Verrucomicrobiota bacterium]
MAENDYNRFMNEVVRKNPGETEFHDAVREFMDVVHPYALRHPEYREAGILERMVEPDRVFQFRICWEDDQGRVQVNRGYRVQFNNTLGPYKGGLRFHPSVTPGILKFLAFEQVFKNSLTLLPLGGGKGGADFDPRGKSDREVMRFCQAMMTELARYIGPDRDVPAGDIGVGEREIGYLYGQYKRLQDQSRAVLTGKGMGYGGSWMRAEATGYGAVYFAEAMLAQAGDGLDGKRCLISGSGNVALYAAEQLIACGASVRTLSDSDGCLEFEEGLDPDGLEAVTELKFKRRGRLSELADRTGMRYHAGRQPWGLAGDVAFPCATQGEIDEKAARELVENGCRAVVEGANMPSTLEAIRLFRTSKLLFAPAKAANAGGVAVSALEMTQNSMRLSWQRAETNEKLRAIMLRIHEQCVEAGETETGLDYLTGANIASFKRVAGAMLSLGLH